MNPPGPLALAALANFDVELPGPDAIGATVRGLDVRDTTPEVAADIAALVYEHKLVSFPNQHVTDDEYIAFARAVGRPQIYFQENYHHPDHPEIFVSSNLPFRGQKIGVAGTGAYWHSDCSFFTDPLSMTMITPKVLPKQERATLYLDTARAYDELPPELKKRLEGLRAIHEAKWCYKVQPCDVDKSLGELLDAFDEMAPAVTHPVFIDHPVNGRRCIYVSSGFVVGFEGLPEAESRALLDELNAHMQVPRFIHKNIWRANQITLWDNRQLNHCAGNKHEGDHSTSYRIGVYDELDFYTTRPSGRLLS